LAAAATLGLAAVAAPQQAEARWGGGWGGGAVAAGVIGGLAAGAIIGSAAAGPYYGGYYGYGPGYAGYGPGYYAYAPGRYYGGGCYVTRQRIWDGWNWRVRRVRVCN
jgi:hypothetical protein